MYKTDIAGNIQALMQEVNALWRQIQELTRVLEHQRNVIFVMDTKLENLQKSIEKVGSFLNG